MAQIYITQYDLDRLNALLEKRLRLDEYDQALLGELNKANIVDSVDIPDDVVTMNSCVRLIDVDGEILEYTLVFPDESDYEKGKISILSPVGCSIIGYRVGDETSVPSPKGMKKVRVDEIIYQPERAGNFDL